MPLAPSQVLCDMLSSAPRGCTLHFRSEGPTMPRFAVWVLALAVGVCALASESPAQRAPRGKVHALQATTDKAGEHPATTEIPGPATVLCINGASETPNVTVNCYITGPGFTGILTKGKTANLTAAGTVTLKCNGQGYMRCDARVDIPPPSK